MLKEHEIMLPYSYLFERLPNEIARSAMTGRPFCIGLVRATAQRGAGDRADAEAEPDWASLIASKTDPVDVPIVRPPRDLFIIYPEREQEAAVRYHRNILGQAVMSSLIDWTMLHSSVVEYRPKPVAAARLWAEGEGLLNRLQSDLVDVGQWIKNETRSSLENGIVAGGGPSDASFASGGYGPDDEVPDDEADDDVEKRVQVAIEKGRLTPVAVGFSDSRQLPVTVWYDGEMWLVNAVMDERRLPRGGRVLSICTEYGNHLLLERGDRWYSIHDD